MACYYRPSVILGSCLSNSYHNKFPPYLTKLSVHRHNFFNDRRKHLITDRSVTKSSSFTNKKDDTTQPFSTEKKKQTFDEMINSRKEEARRSIIVQVQERDSYDMLREHCLQYGNITNMFHYQKGFSQHFFIIEFQTQQIMSEILSSAIFPDKDIAIPVKSTMLWYDNKLSNQTMRKFESAGFMSTTINDENSVEKDMRSVLQNSQGVSQQIEKLYDTLKLNEVDVRLRFYITCLVENCFTGILPYLNVKPFGSSVNGFGARNSDLDLTFLVPFTKKLNTKNSNLVYYAGGSYFNSKKTVKQFLSTVAATIQYFIPGISNIHQILDARVPIIKFKHDYTAMDCDLSASNESGVYMSELLWLCGELNPYVRPLVCIVRKWAEAQKLTNQSPGRWISNFSLSLMVLFYLQQMNLLPSLRKLKMTASSEDIRYTQDNKEFTFLRNPDKISQENTNCANIGSLAEHLLLFFEYYVTFHYEHNAISVLEGKIVKKRDNVPLYICNPFETELNVSKNVSQLELNRIKMFMRDAIINLESEAHEENCNIMVLLGMMNTEQKSKTKVLTERPTNSIVHQKKN